MKITIKLSKKTPEGKQVQAEIKGEVVPSEDTTAGELAYLLLETELAINNTGRIRAYISAE